ncbi:MAG: orotidine-5'-phosphate decarboxylase [Myxococcota bacterium]
MEPFADRLTDATLQVGAPACVGLDPHLDRLPLPLIADDAHVAVAAEQFCMGVLDVVADVVPAVKPQVAFFEALGSPGVAALERVVAAARERGLLVVLDAKRGDIGSTARAYRTATVAADGPMCADSVTLSPYLGPESLDPFLSATDDGIGLFVLVRTSNPGAAGWQMAGAEPVAHAVANWIRAANADRLGSYGFGPVGAVIGATLPKEAPLWRERMPKAWFLVPGYGAQGASAADCRGHARSDGLGALVVSARGVLYPASGRAGADWKDGVRSRALAFAEDLRVNLPA